MAGGLSVSQKLTEQAGWHISVIRRSARSGAVGACAATLNEWGEGRLSKFWVPGNTQYSGIGGFQLCRIWANLLTTCRLFADGQKMHQIQFSLVLHFVRLERERAHSAPSSCLTSLTYQWQGVLFLFTFGGIWFQPSLMWEQAAGGWPRQVVPIEFKWGGIDLSFIPKSKQSMPCNGICYRTCDKRLWNLSCHRRLLMK